MAGNAGSGIVIERQDRIVTTFAGVRCALILPGGVASLAWNFGVLADEGVKRMFGRGTLCGEGDKLRRNAISAIGGTIRDVFIRIAGAVAAGGDDLRGRGGGGEKGGGWRNGCCGGVRRSWERGGWKRGEGSAGKQEKR